MPGKAIDLSLLHRGVEGFLYVDGWLRFIPVRSEDPPSSGLFLWRSFNTVRGLSLVVTSRDRSFLGCGMMMTRRSKSISHQLRVNCSDFRKAVCKANTRAGNCPGQRLQIAALSRASSSARRQRMRSLLHSGVLQGERDF